MKSTREKFNGTTVEPTLNAVVSHGNFPETLMRECSLEIEETFLHLETSFWGIPCGLRKIFYFLFLFCEVETSLRVISICAKTYYTMLPQQNFGFLENSHFAIKATKTSHEEFPVFSLS